jgi:parallel beta-helix repeat protein
MIRTALAPILCALLAGPVFARTIVVDPSVSSGPKTVTDAIKLAQPGDTVRIRGGTYRETSIGLVRSGTPQAPIIVEAAAGETVVICGSLPVTEWADAGNGVWRRGGWKIESQQLFVDGRPLTQIGAANPFTTTDSGDGKVCLPPVGKNASDLVDDSFHYDRNTQTLFIKLADNARPADHLIEASIGASILDGNNHSHIVLRGITFRHNNGTAAGSRLGLVNVGGQGWVIEDCTFEFGDFAGIKLEGDNHILRNSVVRGNGCVGVDVNGSDAQSNFTRNDARPKQNLLIEGLSVTGNNRRAFNEYWHSGGMKLIPGVRGVTVRDCQVTDNAGPGIWFDASLGDNRIEDNLVARNTVGVSIEITYPAAGDDYSALVRNNRVVFNRDQGVYVSASRGVRVERNTLHQNAWDVVVHGMPRAEGALGENVIRDNILGGKNADLIVYNGPDAGSITIDGNLYARSDGKARIGLTSGTGYAAEATDLRSLRRQHPALERSGEVRAIRFKDPAALDFRVIGAVATPDKGWSDSGR